MPQDSWLLIAAQRQSVIFEDGLEDWLQVHGILAIVPLDVEGLKQQALSGAMKSIRSCKLIIIVEKMPSIDWFRENLGRLGYQVVGTVCGNTILR
ncbi:hypothetical protein [Roseimaritima ulvae]|uniref:Uncharacterized protein n=1 Tax=Roseimaritima ulvae TaxID=980254 RepID=A0A5B9QQI6_9BACT|nr:hypothetical protein [Roseimaritima ulvae]QEG41244.1 hypothetical protein UC8_32630 [Roseimaritima ulvae]